jgi:hypothetical protein
MNMVSNKSGGLQDPNTEDLYAELRDILDDALVDGEPFPEDWLEERQVGGN